MEAAGRKAAIVEADLTISTRWRRSRSRPRRPGSASPWPSGSTMASRASTSGTWTCAASGRITARRATRSSARWRSTRALQRHPLPGRGTPGRDGRCESPAPTHGTRSTRRSWRSPAGQRLTCTARTPQPGTSPCARAAGPVRRGHRGRRRAPRRAGGRRALRRILLRQDRGLGSRRGGFPGRPLRQQGGTRGREDHRHADAHLPRRIECDFTVTRLEEDVFQIVTGTAFGNHDFAWMRRHLPGDGSSGGERHGPLVGLCPLGPRARDILGPLTSDDLRDEAFP